MIRCVFVLLVCAGLVLCVDAEESFRVLSRKQIIAASMLPGTDGENINGPSMIRVPAWVKKPLGRYYLYFAHHNGKHIRFAYANAPEGPWTVHPHKILPIDEHPLLRGHIASPDAIIDEQRQRILLFVHGRPKAEAVRNIPDAPGQMSAMAVSADGLNFEPAGALLGPAYLRVFRHRGQWFAVNGRGELFETDALGSPFREIGKVIGPDIPDALDPVNLGEPGAVADRPQRGPDRYAVRHSAVDVVGDRMTIFFSCVGHRPERIFAATVHLRPEPQQWRATDVQEVLRPEHEWEGATLPLQYSKGGRSRAWENGVRDPGVFREGKRRWLLYSTAGENGIGIAELANHR
jgi:hypothetical protein